MVGIAQLVSAPDCGSGGQGFESLYPPFMIQEYLGKRQYGSCRSSDRMVINGISVRGCDSNGLSPSGKAQDFDSCIRWFESS